MAEALSGVTVADPRAMSASEVRALNLNTSFAVIDGKYLTKFATDAYASGDYNTCEVMWGCVREDGPVIGFQNSAIVEETYEAGVAEAMGDNPDTFNGLYPLEGSGAFTVIAQADAAFGAMSYYTSTYERPWTQVDYDLGDTISSYLVNFAATGDPNGEGLPQWKPLSEASGLSYMHLGDSVEFVELDAEHSDFWMNLETVGRVTLDNLTDAKPEVPEEFTQVQTYTLKSGKFPGTEMLVYANDALDHFRFEFSLFGDSFLMNVTAEDGVVVYAFDKSGFFGADAQDFYNVIDQTAWTAR